MTSTLLLAAAALVVDYPLDGSAFPPDFAAPTVLWHDDTGATHWRVTLAPAAGATLVTEVPGGPKPAGTIDERCVSVTNRLPEPTPYQATARAWRPPAATWEAIRSRPGKVRLTIEGMGPSGVVSSGSVSLSISPDPVGAPIFYRDVPLMPSQGEDGVIKPLGQQSLPLIAWRLKDVSRDDSRVLLTGMTTCANCHSFSSDGKTFGMDLDGPDGDKGAYALAELKERTVLDNAQILSWNAFAGRPPDRFTLGFLARVSPDGRHVVATVNDALYVRNFGDYRILQVFYPTRGILAVYSRDTGKIEALPGADDPEYVHCNPVWSPDGKWLVFARAKARDPYDRGKPPATFAGDPNETPMRFELYRIPFHGGKGGVAEPVRGASANGMSNAFPKISPDGKWIVWTRATNGMLLRPDGKLWIVPFEGGTPRELACNTSLMNSWHSFSPNGKWLVFSSKQNTPYTEMFLTHIDAEGNATPPILVENAKAANRAVNIPEFVATGYDAFREITVPAADYRHYVSKGVELAKAGRHEEALAQYRRALAGDPQAWRLNDWRTHDNAAKALIKLGRREEALQHAMASVEIYAKNAETQSNLGYLLFEAGRLPEARTHLDAAVRLAPTDPQVWINRAALRLTVGDAAGAESDYSRTIELQPDVVPAWQGRAIARYTQGNTAGCLADLDEAAKRAPVGSALRREIEDVRQRIAK
ncbi:MAG TPA: tetratricopeptide repeat protein [Candidatus Polarisedimenticolaceae bacterium]